MTQLILSRMKVTPHSGFKAPFDVRQICSRLGYTTVDMDNQGGTARKMMSLAREAPALLGHLRGTGSADVAVSQYPLGVLADRIATTVGNPLRVALLHDVESLRRHTDTAKDVAYLSRYDVIIAHTESMRAWLEDVLPSSPRIVTLGMFDYLVDDGLEDVSCAERPSCVYVVGNLVPKKVRYLYELGPTAVPVKVFGPNCDQAALPAHVSWEGMIDIQRPRVERVDGFGLVWDGDSATELTDPVGGYLRYNAPHKLSFYVAAGIPVMVCEDSALAPLVREHGIGLCVPSVYAGAEEVAACTPQQWEQMCQAVRTLASRVTSGAHTMAALEQALAVAR